MDEEEEETCPDCDGTGFVYDVDDPWDQDGWECPLCNGTGYLVLL